jgi:hypothetical protein
MNGVAMNIDWLAKTAACRSRMASRNGTVADAVWRERAFYTGAHAASRFR